MTKQETEFRVINIIERVLKGQPVEDDFVELKSGWVEPSQAARRIAAHANCARGEPILWIIGLDEKGDLINADMNEVSNWYNGVKSCFDEGVYPNLDKCINVPYLGKIVVALLFETDRAPYVIKNVAGGQITREVPWRSGNRTDSARRSDLIKILVPINLKPAFEIVDGSVSLANIDQGKMKRVYLRLVLYVTPRTKDLLVIPYHRCKGVIRLSSDSEIDFDRITLSAHVMLKEGGIVQDSLTVRHTHSEIVISGPGTLILEGHGEAENIPDNLSNTIEARISIIHDPESEMPVILAPTFIIAEKEDDREIARWILKQ